MLYLAQVLDHRLFRMAKSDLNLQQFDGEQNSAITMENTEDINQCSYFYGCRTDCVGSDILLVNVINFRIIIVCTLF